MTQHDPQEDWIRHTFRQAPWRTQTQATSLVLAVVVLVAVIGALYLAQASRTATAGRRLQQLEAQRQILEQENAQLRAEIAALRSVPRLIADAERLGYRAASAADVEYLTIDEVPPLPEPTPAPALSAADVVPRYEETLEGWLSERLADFRAEFGLFWERTFGRVPRSTPEPPSPAPDDRLEEPPPDEPESLPLDEEAPPDA